MPMDYQFLHQQDRLTDTAAAFQSESKPEEELLLRVVILECGIVTPDAPALPSLPVDTELRLEREPDNSYDRWAIGVSTMDGRRLGYLPSGKNQSVARLMDAGKRIRAYVADFTQSEYRLLSSRESPQLPLRLYMETPLRKEEQNV